MKNIKYFSELFEITSSKRVFQSEWTNHGIPFYRTREIVKLSDNQKIENGLYISNEMYENYSLKYGIPQSGDLLVTGVGTIGICYQVKENDKFYFKDGNIIWFKKKYPGVDSTYVEYAFKSDFIKRQITSSSDGATVGTLTITNANNIQIPLPPLEEQKRIAAILDAADLHRQKTKALLDKYDELAQALFLDMFGDPVTNPKGWEKIKLGSILTYLTSGSRGWAKFYSDQGDVFLRIQNIGYNRLTNKDNIYIKAPKSQEANRTLVYTNDIVLSITADLGRSAVIPENFPRAFINQHLAILRINENFNPYYISAYIASNGGQTFFKKLEKGGVKAGLNFNDLKSYMVFLVPLEIQNKFSQTIKQIECQKLQAEQSLQKAEELFQSLLQKAFKGEL